MMDEEQLRRRDRRKRKGRAKVWKAIAYAAEHRKNQNKDAEWQKARRWVHVLAAQRS